VLPDQLRGGLVRRGRLVRVRRSAGLVGLRFGLAGLARVDGAFDIPRVSGSDRDELGHPVAHADRREDLRERALADALARVAPGGRDRRAQARVEALLLARGGVVAGAQLVLDALDLALDPLLALVEGALDLPEHLAEALDRGHHDEVDGLVDRRADLVDDLM